jgi:hypothetical protein
MSNLAAKEAMLLSSVEPFDPALFAGYSAKLEPGNRGADRAFQVTEGALVHTMVRDAAPPISIPQFPTAAATCQADAASSVTVTVEPFRPGVDVESVAPAVHEHVFRFRCGSEQTAEAVRLLCLSVSGPVLDNANLKISEAAGEGDQYADAADSGMDTWCLELCFGCPWRAVSAESAYELFQLIRLLSKAELDVQLL